MNKKLNFHFQMRNDRNQRPIVENSTDLKSHPLLNYIEFFDDCHMNRK